MIPVVIFVLVFLLFFSLRIVRPMERGLIERMGKYHEFAEPGFYFLIPFIEKIYKVNITEIMINADSQEIITRDNLNAKVDAQIYYQIKLDEKDVFNSQYNVNEIDAQIVALARTTLRNIIGTMTLEEANGNRNRINSELRTALSEETFLWGIKIVRAELKEIDPPKDVQATMNMVVKAKNEKLASVDFATAKETVADGEKRSEIKKAEGIKEANILKAQGEAEAIRLVNESADKFFVGNAQLLRRLQAMENALENNTKIVIPQGSDLINVINETNGPILPIGK